MILDHWDIFDGINYNDFCSWRKFIIGNFQVKIIIYSKIFSSSWVFDEVINIIPVEICYIAYYSILECIYI